jgi:hypothetical protein
MRDTRKLNTRATGAYQGLVRIYVCLGLLAAGSAVWGAVAGWIVF